MDLTHYLIAVAIGLIVSLIMAMVAKQSLKPTWLNWRDLPNSPMCNVLIGRREKMTKRQHLDLLEYGDHRPRVVEHDIRGKYYKRYVAWMPDWEGPARPDFAAAYADLNERRGL